VLAQQNLKLILLLFSALKCGLSGNIMRAVFYVKIDEYPILSADIDVTYATTTTLTKLEFR